MIIVRNENFNLKNNKKHFVKVLKENAKCESGSRNEKCNCKLKINCQQKQKNH